MDYIVVVVNEDDDHTVVDDDGCDKKGEQPDDNCDEIRCEDYDPTTVTIGPMGYHQKSMVLWTPEYHLMYVIKYRSTPPSLQVLV